MSQNQLNTKSLARIAAIQTLYQLSHSPDKDISTLLSNIIAFYKNPNIKSDYDLNAKSSLKLKPSYNHLTELVKYTYENLAKIDEQIDQYLTQDWTLDSLPNLLLALLRVAFAEIRYFPETPGKVIINEYTDIANDMLDENEIGFVNSVLDKIVSTRGVRN